MGQDILGLAKRVYAGAPELAEREGRDYFIGALPQQLKMAVAALCKLCVTFDTSEDDGEFKKARRVGNGASNGNGNGYDNGTGRGRGRNEWRKDTPRPDP